MQLITNSLINISRKAVKLLKRDFFELEMLQSSSQLNVISDFCHKALLRTKSLLQNELVKYSESIYFDNEIFNNLADKDTIIVTIVDSITNFTKSIPFFALSIVYLKKVNDDLIPTSIVYNFPALDEIYYAEKGGGVWLEKSAYNALIDKGLRLRISGCSNTAESIIGTDNNKINFVNNFLYTRSYFYEVALFISGKLDALFFNNLNPQIRMHIELMIKESGGLVIKSNSNTFIASNYNLFEKLKNLLMQNNLV